ncbi:MAG: nucleotide-diphospho-sugar transferase [Benniella sp.]|nr:MAG: nucleotide-diphospho-sugar transferase [Benniella sp.]
MGHSIALTACQSFSNTCSPSFQGVNTFGTIPHEQWRLPTWIQAAKVRNGDYAKMRLGMNRTSLVTRHRWRYMSGFLAQHALLDPYEFFWRIDPGVEIFCDLGDDPMMAMKSSGQKFAWSISSVVNEAGVPGAWSLIQKFKTLHRDLLPSGYDEAFLARESGNTFTACTYNTQNSIGRVGFFRSAAYQTYFDLIDQEGLFYYEKWDDGVAMTIGLSLLLRRTDTLFLEPLGWRHGSAAYCPDQHCPCNPQLNNLPLHLSCTPFWKGLSKSPEMKRRLECREDGKCVLYVSKLG